MSIRASDTVEGVITQVFSGGAYMRTDLYGQALIHLPQISDQPQDLATWPEVGQRVSGTVIGVEAPLIRLHVSLRTEDRSLRDEWIRFKEQFPVGTVAEVTSVRISSPYVLFELQSVAFRVLLMMSSPENARRYQVGSGHRVRIAAFDELNLQCIVQDATGDFS
jgi:ribosomal protein S1